MIYSIKGTVSQKGVDFLCIETDTLEWQLTASFTTISRYKIGEQVRVHTYFHYSENSMLLLGFASLEEKELFLNLIKVNGVGPKAAIKMLSGISPQDFITALEQENVAQLTRIPGLGKATAQKVILALKGKLVTASGELLGEEDEMLASLAAMGFDKKQVAKVLAEVRREQGSEADESMLLKAAIVKLSM